MLQIPTNIEEAIDTFQRVKPFLTQESETGDYARRLQSHLKNKANATLQQARRQNPLAFLKVSYEQALKLNCWIWGILFYADFDANRQGKTAASIFNALLYMFPNDARYKVFHPYIDHLGRKVQVLQRPSIETIYKIKTWMESKEEQVPSFNPHKQPYEEENHEATKLIFEKFIRPERLDPNALLTPSYSQHEHTIWVGAPDIQNAIKPIIFPAWLKWTPQASIEEQSEYKLRIKLKIQHGHQNSNVTNWTIIYKTYESEDQKWSMGAVDGIVLTEGVPKPIYSEVKARFTSIGFGSWDYTPYEPKNTGAKSHLAYQIFKGKQPLPLRSHVFSGFGIHVVPEFILPKVKKDDMIKNYTGPEKTARIEGNFFTDSPQILSNLDRPFHALNISFEELLKIKPNLLLFRSMDPGYDHPTAAVWAALSPANEWFIYRFYSKRGTTIPERCQDVITMSNNARRITPFHRLSSISRKYDILDILPERPLDNPYPAQRDKSEKILRELTSQDIPFSNITNSNKLTAIPSLPPSESADFYEEYHPNANSEIYVATLLDYHAFKTDESTGRPIAHHYRRSGLIVRESPTTRPRDRAIAVNSTLTKLHHLSHPITRQTPGSRLYFLINEPGVAEALERLESLFWARITTGENVGAPKDEMQSEDDDEFDSLSYLICSNFRWARLSLPKIQ